MPNYNNIHDLDNQDPSETKIYPSIHKEEEMIDKRNIDVNQKIFLELLISIYKNHSNE